MNKMDNIKVRNYAPGEIIIKEGDTTDDFFIILSGKAEIIKKNPYSQEVSLGILEPGEVFGELGIILGLPRQATVRAKTNLEVEVISPRLFSSYFSFDKEIGDRMRALIQTMAERIRENGNRLAMLETKVAEQSSSDAEIQNGKVKKIRLVAVSEPALKALNGMQGIDIVKFPFRVGRYSKRSSDRLFHRNDLYLYDKKPYIISRSHFAIYRVGDKFYFQDSSSQNGCIVNGKKVHGVRKQIRSVTKRIEKKVLLKKGENDVYLGEVKDDIHFKIII